jgi:hypothetical protein
MSSVARPVVEPASRYRRIEVPILGGMYGTELIGMGILLSLPFSFTAYRMDQEMWMREKLFGTVFARSRSPFAELQSSIQELSAGSKEWTGLAPYFWRSFINATHIEAGTYTMTFPYMNALSNKRLPFLSEEVLDWLSLIPREYLCNFQIYRWLFENRIPEWTGVPFNSEMSRYVLSLASVKPVNAQTGVTSPFDFQGFAARNAHSEATRRLGFQGENLSELFAHKGDSLAARLANAMVWYNLQRDFPSDKGELASI